MINLIPPAARKGVVTEYWVRVATVWMFLLGTALILVAVMQSPAYVLVKLQLNAFSDGVAEATLQEEEFQAGQAAIKDAHQLSSLLLDTTQSTSFVTISQALNELAGEEITVSGIDMGRSEGQISTLAITGTAATREGLSSYRNRIEAHELFSEVFLPLSNLAKEEDILFQITIDMAEDNQEES